MTSLLLPNIIFDILNDKFLLSKKLKAKIILKEENAKIITVLPCRIQRGLI